jgi:hypothetical protein
LEIARLDATICMFAPSVIVATREATKFKRSVHFLTGELSRLCQDCLRQVEGCQITVHEMAVTAQHQKGLDAGDAELLADFTKRIAWTLNRMLARGAVDKHGYGISARWGLTIRLNGSGLASISLGWIFSISHSEVVPHGGSKAPKDTGPELW